VLQNFVSAATGMLADPADPRLYARKTTENLGLLGRTSAGSTSTSLLPLSFVLRARAWCRKGVIQNVSAPINRDARPGGKSYDDSRQRTTKGNTVMEELKDEKGVLGIGKPFKDDKGRTPFSED